MGPPDHEPPFVDVPEQGLGIQRERGPGRTQQNDLSMEAAGPRAVPDHGHMAHGVHRGFGPTAAAQVFDGLDLGIRQALWLMRFVA